MNTVKLIIGIITIMLFSLIGFGQSNSLVIDSTWISTKPLDNLFDANESYDCELVVNKGEWISNDSITKCNHIWVYEGIYNDELNMTYAVYCPCGCGHTDVENRICEKCLRKESKTTTYSYIKILSKYNQLINKKNLKQ